MQKPEGKMYNHKGELPKSFTSAAWVVVLQI